MLVPVPVEEIMGRDVVSVPEGATVMDAATEMRSHEVGSVLVVRDDEPVGIVTEGDLVACLCEIHDLGSEPVETLMSTPLVTTEATADVTEAAGTMADHDIEHLPVLRDGALVGLVSSVDLSYFIPKLVHAQRDRGLETVERRPPLRLRPDTAYERDDWAFEYRGADETRVDVGDEARFAKTITEEDVASFAEASGDTNRLHLDADYAAGTRFGRPIVHGVLATGLISAALARLPGLTIYLSQELSFLGPVDVGDRATAVCEIREDLGGGKYRVQTAIYDGDDEQVVDGEAVVLVDELPAHVEADAEATA